MKKVTAVRKSDSSKAKKLVWLSSLKHNYADRFAYKLNEDYASDAHVKELWTNPKAFFNYGNLIDTSVIVQCPINTLLTLPNYLLVMARGKIESRWFVMDATSIGGDPNSEKPEEEPNSWMISLKRDVVIDNISVLSSGVFRTERGMLADEYSAEILNSESISPSKIKVGEIDIKDAWGSTQAIAIYYDSSAERILTGSTGTPTPSNITISQIERHPLLFANPITITNTSIIGNIITVRDWTSITFSVRFAESGGAFHYHTFDALPFRNNLGVCTNVSFIVSSTMEAGFTRNQAISNLSVLNGNSFLVSAFISLFNSDQVSLQLETTDFVNSFNNKVCLMGDNTTQTFVTTTTSNSIHNQITANSDILTAFRAVSATWRTFSGSAALTTSTGFQITGGIGAGTNTILPNQNLANLNISGNLFSALTNIVLPAANIMNNANMGCVIIPTGPNLTIDSQSLSHEAILKMCSVGTTESLEPYLFDIQLLPYVPAPFLDKAIVGTNLDTTLLTDSEQATIVNITTTGNSIIYKGFQVWQADWSRIIQLPNNSILNPQSNIKLSNICEKVIFKNPHHTSAFEIKPTNNYGITSVIISGTLRPQIPFIRVQPQFNGLYGSSYTDDRGLFIEGGFSLPRVSSAWANYRANNMMYQQIFDREIQSQEFSNEESFALQKAQADLRLTQQQRAGTLGMLGSGLGMLGSLAGGSALGIGGAALGIAGSTNALATSRENHQMSMQAIGVNERIAAESISAKTDIFDLNNQSIKSKPNTLAKGTDLTINTRNKIYIELYTCKDKERTFVENYIKFYGMSIQRIGSVSQYILGDSSYLEGRFLQLPGVSANITNAINRELSGGKYIQEGLFN